VSLTSRVSVEMLSSAGSDQPRPGLSIYKNLNWRLGLVGLVSLCPVKGGRSRHFDYVYNWVASKKNPSLMHAARS